MMKRIKISLAAAAVLLVVLAAGGQTAYAQKPSKKDVKRSEQLIALADKAYNLKNFEEAIANYAEAIKLVPVNAKAHFWKGNAHYRLNQNDEALAELDTALTQGFRAEDVYKIRWLLHFNNKDFDAAMADLRPLLELDPRNLTYLSHLGEISFAKGDYATALDAYQKAALIDANRGDTFYQIAEVQAKLGNIPGQGDAAEEAIKKNTQFLAESLLLLGDARQKQKRYPEAISAYRRALMAKPGVYQLYRTLADLYRGEGDFNEAIEISKEGLRKFPNDGYLYTDLGYYYSMADRYQEAVDASEAGSRLLPKQPTAYTNLCRAYNDVKKYELAISTCKKALVLSPNDGETYFYMGRASEYLGRTDDAGRYYKQAVAGLLNFTQNNPEFSDGFYLLGNAYAADRQYDKAIEAYNRSLELSPKFARSRANLGILYVFMKRKDSAIEQYEKLVSLNSPLAKDLKQAIDGM